MTKENLPAYIKTAIIIIIIYFGWQLLVLCSAILIPLLIAWLISFVLLPVQLFFENKIRMPRGIGAFICTLLVGFLFYLVLVILAGEASSFSADLAGFHQKLTAASGQFQNWFSPGGSQLDLYISKAAGTFISFFSSLAGRILLTITSMIIWLILIVVFVFFFLYYHNLLHNFTLQIFQKKDKEQVQSSILAVRSLINHYLFGILIEMVLVALIGGILLSVFGIQHAIVIALLAALLNIIPYVGIYSALLLSALVTLLNSGLTAAITTASILLFVHLIDGNILMPRVMGSQVKLNSFITVLAVLCGGLVWGIPGMFLFIPLTAIVRIVLEQIPSCKPFATLLGIDKTISRRPLKKLQVK